MYNYCCARASGWEGLLDRREGRVTSTPPERTYRRQCFNLVQHDGLVAELNQWLWLGEGQRPQTRTKAANKN